MSVLSPALEECIAGIDATLERIKSMLNESARQGEEFRVELAAMQKRMDEIRRGEAQ